MAGGTRRIGGRAGWIGSVEGGRGLKRLPRAIGGSGVGSLILGGKVFCALDEDGALECFGDNEHGQTVVPGEP